MGTVTEHLKLAKALISDEGNWTQKTFARDVLGERVFPGSKEACRWCSIGACLKTSSDLSHGGDTTVQFLDSASFELHNLNIEAANDTKTHAEVMEIFDLAIKYSEGSLVS